MAASVIFEKAGPIARITLDRPDKLNAIDYELGLQLWNAFARCQDEPSIRAIVLAGAGRAFSRLRVRCRVQPRPGGRFPRHGTRCQARNTVHQTRSGNWDEPAPAVRG